MAMEKITNEKFNSLSWHDAVIDKIGIDRRNPGIKISVHTWAWTNYCGQVDPLGGEGRKEFSCSSRRVERGGYPKENWNLATRRYMGQNQ